LLNIGHNVNATCAIDYNDCDLLKYSLAVSQNMCIIYAIETDI